MGRIVGYIATSLDGYIASAAGGIDWLTPFETVDCGYDAFLRGIDCVVMGRLTYEKCLSFGIGWPYAGKNAVVVTSRAVENLPERTRVWSAPVAELVAHLKSATGDSWIVGGSRLQQAILDMNGIDCLDVFIIPILLGNGIPLFRSSDTSHALRLLDMRQLPMGMVHLRYDLAPRP